MEISLDTSHCLLNAKEEYNRCLLPSRQVLGPPLIKEQELTAVKIPHQQLSPFEEEEAISRARTAKKKRLRESREAQARSSKKIRLAWLYKRDDHSQDQEEQEHVPDLFRKL